MATIWLIVTARRWGPAAVVAAREQARRTRSENDLASSDLKMTLKVTSSGSGRGMHQNRQRRSRCFLLVMPGPGVRCLRIN
jgi:hypothetical protein